MIIQPNIPYIWSSNSGGFLISAGVSCDIAVSLDDGVTFNVIGQLPLTSGDLAAYMNARNCLFMVTNAVGEISTSSPVQVA